MNIFMQYNVVYDLIESGYHGWDGTIPTLIFLCIGVLLFLLRNNSNAEKVYIFISKSQKPFRKFCRFIFVLGITINVLAFSVSYYEYRALKKEYQNNNVSIVEGKITSFKSGGFGRGDTEENFCIKDICFSYSGSTQSFNQTVVYGGPVNGGLQARVTYINNNERSIVRLELVL